MVLYADLAIQKTDSETQSDRKIIIEVKSFISPSPFKDFENALGQYILYRDLLQLAQDEYQEIYLSINDTVYKRFFRRPSIQPIIRRNQVALLVVNMEQEEIVQWIS